MQFCYALIPTNIIVFDISFAMPFNREPSNVLVVYVLRLYSYLFTNSNRYLSDPYNRKVGLPYKIRLVIQLFTFKLRGVNRTLRYD